ncbi:glycosyltransferase family 4 protein [Caballeronia ptereochthonis]|uniref:BceJ n=1 Tax=Caballeronia ptereochthonis TaxID=1777144 RepID=A0A158BRX8_9BURK|nr:glycosyltransferase family 4 protein [Caballeronia ptereochthonis]SAK72835.1 BceJ [Caballeronia ptereochthonis]
MKDVSNMRPIRVLHVGPGWGQRGGIASVLEELKAFSDVFLARGVSVRFCETHGFRRSSGMLRFLVTDVPNFLRHLIGGVDIVHLHVSVKGSFYRKLLLCAIALLLRKRIVFHLHAGNFSTFVCESKRFVTDVARAFLRASNAMIGVSHAIAEELVELGGDRARLFVVGNSASLAERALAEAGPCDPARVEEPPHILFAGRLAETKGIGDLLEAVALLVARGVAVRLIVAGSGDLKRWEDEAHRLSIRDRVVFPGWLEGDDKLECYRTARIFCMPSHYEAFGIATLEAMFAGLPVVGTSVGGFPDLVEQGRSGFLVSPSNPSELAQALRTLLDDDALAAEMGRRGRQQAFERFSCNSIVERYVDVYRRTMRSKP